MKNIVVGIDFSNSAMTAMRHAISLALHIDATLHLVWVKTPGVKMNSDEIKDDSAYNNHVQEKMQEWVKLCKDESPETTVNSVVLEGKVHTAVTHYANNLPDSMIVMGAHGASGFEEGYIGNNAFRLINDSTVPVLIMRENIKITRDLVKIFVPIDLSFETLQKMKMTTMLAKSFAAQVYLFGVNYPNNAETRHIINVQLRHAAEMCDDANVRYLVEAYNVNNNDVCNTILNHAKEVDANLITIMREEQETDFTASRNMRQILSTCPMPLLIIPNKNAFSVAK